jgi:hypothetical protein
LLGSGAVHALLIGLVLLAAAGAHRSVPLARSGPVYTVVEPIDNRAERPEGEAGGGSEPPVRERPDDDRSSPRNTSALGAPDPTSEAADEGSGSGGGSGPGSGAGTSFFEANDNGQSYVYLIDRSGSMRQYGSLELAKREVLASLARLPETVRVAVLFYNADTEQLTQGLEPATPEAKARIERKLGPIVADGSTRPRPALEAALALRPEVVFLLTDGQELSLDDVERLRDRAQGTRIHTVELGGRTFQHPAGERALERLARVTGGKYRHVDVRSP